MKNKAVLLRLIKILSDGRIHSGEQLGKIVNLAQVDISKQIHILHKFGVEFNIFTDNSYQLTNKMDLLDYNRIYDLVRHGKIIIKSVTSSTNQFLLERVNQLSSGDACIAEHQTSGRGRRGRYWVSPFGCNLYLSLYWHLKQKQTAFMGLSLVTGLVIAEMLNKLIGANIKVKWPNDLYLNEKKLAGILIEIINESNNTTHIVIGIGLNIAMSRNYTTHINQEWINLKQKNIQVERNIIAGQIILTLRHELMQFEKYGFIPFIKRWLVLDAFLHKKVRLHMGDHVKVGVVKGINNSGAILLEQNGKIISYTSGEISLRPVN